MNKSNTNTSSGSSSDKAEAQAISPLPSSLSPIDWERLDALSDAEIDTSDIAPLTDEDFARSEWRLPASLKPALAPAGALVMVELAVDKEILAWFQSQGQDYERRMLAALRLYAEAHQSAA